MPGFPHMPTHVNDANALLFGLSNTNRTLTQHRGNTHHGHSFNRLAVCEEKLISDMHTSCNAKSHGVGSADLDSQ